MTTQRVKAFVFSLVLVWIILKMVFFALGDSDMGYNVGIFANLLFILSISAFALWVKFRSIRPEDSNFIDDIKSVLQRSMVYVLLVGAFIFVYYQFIDPDLIEHRVEARMDSAKEEIAKHETFKDFIATQQMVDKEITEAEYLTKFEDQMRSLVNPLFNTGGSLLVLTMWAMSCAIMVTFLFRTVLFK